ncbi:MAG: hypothetical protein FJ053_11020 [Cyanobacteria bacterium M_surface_10_m1_298]|nr:hypothetical protein [Cyanobacteria bacterium M_surface_10_m1_298]
MLLSLTLLACQRPKPPEPSTTPADAPQGKSDRSRSREELLQQRDTLIQEAEELFNRGENDLGCDRVNKADALSRSLSVATTSAQEQFSAACSAP